MEEEFISHYGVKRRSGRYPWGSGENPYQGDQVRNKRDFNKGRIITKKRKLEDKYYKIMDASTREAVEMMKNGVDNDTRSLKVWNDDNKKLDPLKRKITRLEIRWLADKYDIYDKKISDLAGDYKWAKETSVHYKLADKVSDDSSKGLRGAEYYSKLADEYKAELKQRIPKETLRKIESTIKDEKYWHDMEKWLNAL